LPGLTFNHNLHDLCFLRNWDYKHESLCLALEYVFHI
jgi:hypothetical protein